MIPVLLHLGPIKIYSYGLMMALGFIAAYLVVTADCKRRGLNPDYASALVVWCGVAGIVGSRIYDVLDNLHAYMADPSAMVFSGAGFVWYGGLAGGIVAVWLVARHYRVRFLTTADMAAPAAAIGQAFGRIGCLLSGDGDWGLPSKLPWAMAFPHAIVGWNAQTVLKLNERGQLVSGFYPGVRVQPTFIYEAVLYFGVFIVLWSLRRKIHVEGRLFYLYLIMAGTSRFLVEFVRINPRVLLGLSEAQLIAIVMMVAGTVAYYFSAARQPVAQPRRTKEALGA
jgi:phosphatidylglycerol---prolipoprotein diacylglyceryl transferase